MNKSWTALWAILVLLVQFSKSDSELTISTFVLFVCVCDNIIFESWPLTNTFKDQIKIIQGNITNYKRYFIVNVSYNHSMLLIIIKQHNHNKHSLSIDNWSSIHEPKSNSESCLLLHLHWVTIYLINMHNYLISWQSVG